MAKNVGIKAIQVHIPKCYVTQDDLEEREIELCGEEFRAKIKGKYTKGLCQTNLSFCTDREDTASIAMNAVAKLMASYGYKQEDFGRLEVGTESALDRSKSVKSFIMKLFPDNKSMMGVDNTNACYGGTAAFLNSLAWLESSQWDGRLALVVAADIAVYDDRSARPTGGCGAVAMVLGPDAPIVFEKGSLASYFTHGFDFYKPNPMNPHPIVDGPLSLTLYYECLEECYMNYRARGGKASLDDYDYICFHTPFINHIKKCTGRLQYLQGKENGDPEIEKTRGDRVAVSAQSKEAAPLFAEKVKPSTLMSSMCGNGYTASLYMSIASLIYNKDLNGKRILCFSYGSGAASSLYTLTVNQDLSEMRKALNLEERLNARIRKTVADYDADVKRNDNRYRVAPYMPEDSLDLIEDGAWYLDHIDDKWRRIYKQKI